MAAQRDEIDRIDRFGARGMEPWATFRRLGLGDVARAELAWIVSNAAALA